MRQIWLALTLFAAFAALASTAHAQRFSPLLNMNTHEGKYASGGVGFAAGFGGAGGSSFRRESPGTKNIDGALEPVFKKRNAQSMTRSMFGASLNFQIGSDNNTIGTNFYADIYSMSIGTNATRLEDNDAYEAIDESVTLIFFGFNFMINFYKSEYIETDGRRTRDDWGLALILGPRISMMMGDFSDLNGMSSIGLTVGLMADVPLPVSGAEDLMSISPFLVMEVNMRQDVDGGLLDTNPLSPTAGKEVINDNFDIGFFNRSQEDLNGDGVADFDGIAVRRHNFIPAYQANLGADFNLTPIFLSRSGTIINNWRFRATLVISVPMNLGFMMAEYPGAALWGADEVPVTFMFSLGASYLF